MHGWLRNNRQQYQLLMALSNFLIGQGFNPVPTSPTHDLEFRQDHTLAILDLLSSFRLDDAPWPLTVFSTGPLYQPRAGRWLETIDVEIFGFDEAADDSRALKLIAELVPQLAPAGASPPCLLVLGQVEWLDRALNGEGLLTEARQTVRRLFMEGNLVEAERAVSRLKPNVRNLCVPQDEGLFFERLSTVLPQVVRTNLPAMPAGWRVEWDLSLTGNWPYYTGLVFSLYLPGIGQPLLNGGRFRLARAGRPWTGVGFTLYLEALMAYAGIIESGEVRHV
ncbi:MAG: ATP phosphoribosyltransferase regulatory subunit [Thermaerobacter sp.]|nr:ATP phosphoribosyltransferase regulatory subunit [Thermaerobacter sp.]